MEEGDPCANFESSPFQSGEKSSLSETLVMNSDDHTLTWFCTEDKDRIKVRKFGVGSVANYLLLPLPVFADVKQNLIMMG